MSFSLPFHVAVSRNINKRYHREERQVKRMGFTTVLSTRVGNFDDVWVIMKSCFSVCVSGDGGAPTRTCSSVGTRVLYEHGEDFIFYFFRPGRMLNLVFLPAPAVSSTCAMKRHTQLCSCLTSATTWGNITPRVEPCIFGGFSSFCAAQPVHKKNHPFHFPCKLHRETLELERFVFL